MNQFLAHVALIVRDYDEAIAFFVGKLDFLLLEDRVEEDKRWVLIAPPGQPPEATSILLARASTPAQESTVGNQAGGRVFLFLRTDDFWRDYQAMREKGITFVREPQKADYGTVAVFLDLYGNRWDLIGSPSA